MNEQTPRKGTDDVKHMLQVFNRYDETEQGLLRMAHLHKLLQELHLDNVGERMAQVIKLIPLQDSSSVTFDEFLVIVSQMESKENSSILKVDHRIFQFLKILDQYRKKCQESGNYPEAKKASNKIKSIKERQALRKRVLFNAYHQNQLKSELMRQEKMKLDFKQTWDSHQRQYDKIAEQMLKGLKLRQEEERSLFQQQMRKDLNSKLKFSKYVLELRSKEKNLVKLQKYEEAQITRKKAEKMEYEERLKRQEEINDILDNKLNNLQKQHHSAFNAMQKKIQKDKAQQLKQREQAYQIMQVKRKNVISQMQHRFNQQLRRALQQLKQMLSLLNEEGKKKEKGKSRLK